VEAEPGADELVMAAPDPGSRVRFLDPRSETDQALLGDRALLFAPAQVGDTVAIPLRSSRGVTLGSGIWRKPGLEDAIRGIPGVGEVRLSPLGGTVGPGGPCWLGLLLVTRLSSLSPRPLDLLLRIVQEMLRTEVSRFGATVEKGRVEGAWCPGFSDLSVAGRKLAGVGFKLTREIALVRLIIGVRPPGEAELSALDRCHRTFGLEVRPERLTWLAELMGRPGLDWESALLMISGRAQPNPEKIKG